MLYAICYMLYAIRMCGDAGSNAPHTSFLFIFRSVVHFLANPSFVSNSG